MAAVEAVEQACQFMQIVRDPVRFEVGSSSFNNFRKGRYSFDEIKLFGCDEQLEGSCANSRVNAAFNGRFKDPADSGMGILDIVNRVVGRLLLGKIDIKNQLGVGFPHQEEVPGGISPDLVDEVTQGDITTGTLGYFNL